MKSIMILGSRNPQGQTARAAQAFVEGLGESGTESERVLLPESNLERCRQCEDDGWGICRPEGKCVIEDDFASILESVIGADLVGFATPVYFSDLSESLRGFLDRVRRVTRHASTMAQLEGKPAVGICVAGGGGGGAPNCVLNLERTLSTCGFEVMDLIPVRRQNLELKQDLLRATGRWVAKQLSTGTVA